MEKFGVCGIEKASFGFGKCGPIESGGNDGKGLALILLIANFPGIFSFDSFAVFSWEIIEFTPTVIAQTSCPHSVWVIFKTKFICMAQ
jgi:hypothetical protein